MAVARRQITARILYLANCAQGSIPVSICEQRVDPWEDQGPDLSRCRRIVTPLHCEPMMALLEERRQCVGQVSRHEGRYDSPGLDLSAGSASSSSWSCELGRSRGEVETSAPAEILHPTAHSLIESESSLPKDPPLSDTGALALRHRLATRGGCPSPSISHAETCRLWLRDKPYHRRGGRLAGNVRETRISAAAPAGRLQRRARCRLIMDPATRRNLELDATFQASADLTLARRF